MCQNITMRLNWAWIKRYCVFCSKIYNTLHNCHNFPVGSREAARDARICETSLLSQYVPRTQYMVFTLSIAIFRQTGSQNVQIKKNQMYHIWRLSLFKYDISQFYSKLWNTHADTFLCMPNQHLVCSHYTTDVLICVKYAVTSPICNYHTTAVSICTVTTKECRHTQWRTDRAFAFSCIQI